MPHLQLPNIRLHVEQAGSGPPLILVHGSWGDARDWNRVADSLAERFSVVRYDRRGHSRSERPATQGSPQEDADDLIALADALGFDRFAIAANSWGGIVSLHCAIRHPGRVSRLALHEPPLFDLIKGDPTFQQVYDNASQQVREAAQLIENGRDEDGARTFVETAVGGPGFWETFPAAARRTFVRNAQTFLDEMRDTGALYIGDDELRNLAIPVLLTKGTTSPPIYAPILERLAATLPDIKSHTFHGAGHTPQISHPAEYSSVLVDFLS